MLHVTWRASELLKTQTVLDLETSVQDEETLKEFITNNFIRLAPKSNGTKLGTLKHESINIKITNNFCVWTERYRSCFGICAKDKSHTNVRGRLGH